MGLVDHERSDAIEARLQHRIIPISLEIIHSSLVHTLRNSSSSTDEVSMQSWELPVVLAMGLCRKERASAFSAVACGNFCSGFRAFGEALQLKVCSEYFYFYS